MMLQVTTIDSSVLLGTENILSMLQHTFLAGLVKLTHFQDLTLL